MGIDSCVFKANMKSTDSKQVLTINNCIEQVHLKETGDLWLNLLITNSSIF